jgi:AhpD family alkylhydroperoxidase
METDMPSTTAAATDPALAPSADDALRLPRLPPLAPRSLWVRLFASLVARQLGKVMTPVWVIYARMPRLLWPQMLMVRLAQKGLSLDPTLVDLVQIRVSLTNGCTFCSDLHRAVALRSRRDARKLAAISRPDLAPDPAAAPLDALSNAERLALAFADEIARGGEPGAATYAALATAFDERKVVELVWLCSFTTYLNRMSRALGIGSDGFCDLAG